MQAAYAFSKTNLSNTKANTMKLFNANKAVKAAMLSAALLSAGTLSAQTYLGVNYTPLNLGTYSTTTGTAGAAGSTYLYTNAGTAVINGVSTNIDVKVTLVSKSATGVNPGQFSIGGGGYTGDGFDQVDASSVTVLSNGAGAVGGYNSHFQPAWNWARSTGTTPNPAGITTIETVWKFDFLVAGTSTPAFINVVPVTIDNDGSNTTTGTVNEVVVYSPTATSYTLNNQTNETQSGNTFTGPTTNQANIGTNPAYNVYAYYYNVSSVTWTSRHIVNGNGTTIGPVAAGRLSSIGFNPSVNGISTTNTPGFSAANISGTVFNDVNGLTDNTVNGTGTGTPGNTQLYATLVAASTGLTVACVAVNSNGTFTFSGAPQGTNYKVEISTNPSTPNQAPAAQALPGNWTNTGENNSTSAGSDGTADGTSAAFSTPVLANNVTTVQNINFGIEERPETAVNQMSTQVNPNGTNNFTIPAGVFQTSNVGTNANTVDYSGGTVSAIRIAAFPANVSSITINGTSYSSSNWPAAGVTVPYTSGTGPSQAIAVKPVSGSPTVVINFTSIDNAGIEDLTPGSVTIPFAPAGISGNVFNDANGLKDNTVNGTGTTAGTTLYAILINNATGKLAAVTTVAAGGAYSFANVGSNSYSVELSTNTATIGNNPPAVALPAGWVNTGENIGTAAGSDGTVDGLLQLGTITGDVTNANFGIERTPTSDNKSAVIAMPAPNSFVTLNGGANPPFFTGADPEDQPTSATLLDKSVQITTLPVKGQLWYNGAQITAANTVINNFKPSLMQVKFTGTGYANVSFTYAYVDAAGIAAPTPATYNLSWATALPVKLVSFDGRTHACNATLSWTTAEEKELKSFVVERSTNGANYTALAEIAAKNNANGDYTATFAQTDAVAYYRLRINENDGRYNYSGVVKLLADCNGGATVTVWPNPTTAQLSVDGVQEGSIIQLYNAAGQLLQNVQSNGNIQHFDLGNQPSGLFYVMVTNAAGEKTSFKIIKQ
jgi:hypothetical protein